MIQTVLGLIDKADLKTTLMHEHLCVDLKRIRKDNNSAFRYNKENAYEVKKAKDSGINSIVEVSTIDMGRNVEDLIKYAVNCDVNVIASTGFYLDEYHPEYISELSVNEISEIFIKELTEGIGNTKIKAGLIGEVASGKVMTVNEAKVIEAAGMAAKSVGCAVYTHCQLGRLGLKQIELLTKHGMNPNKIILGHIDLSDDIDYMVDLLGKGVNIGFDTIGKTNYLSDEKRADNLKKLVEMGFSKQIVLSNDVSKVDYMSYNKKYMGYTAVMNKFIPMMIKKGINEKDLNYMLVENPKRILDINK